MIQEFIDRFMAKKPELEAIFAAKHPDSYKEIVTNVVTMVSDSNRYGDPDPGRVHQIDDGDYQGTLVYVIGDNSYQPSDYWYVTVGYGSCSGCDTLQAIQVGPDLPPTPEQVKDYMILALHIVEGMKKFYD